jgi:hypothetical protein
VGRVGGGGGWQLQVRLAHIPYCPHSAPDTLHLTPCTLLPTPCTLHPTPHTLHPIRSTLVSMHHQKRVFIVLKP